MSFEVWTLREVECDLKYKEMYVFTTCAALPSQEEFAESPSNSMMMVQQRLSMAEASIDSKDKRMLVSTTSIIYPGMIKRGA